MTDAGKLLQELKEYAESNYQRGFKDGRAASMTTDPIEILRELREHLCKTHNEFTHDYQRDAIRCPTCKLLKRAADVIWPTPTPTAVDTLKRRVSWLESSLRSYDPKLADHIISQTKGPQ